MRITNRTYRSINELSEKLDLSKYAPDKTLIQVFSGFVTELEVLQIHSILIKKNSNIKFIGTTTAGEINDGEVFHESIVISIIEFKTVAISCCYFDHDNALQIGIDIAQALISDNTKAIVLFIDGLFTNASDVLDGIASIDSRIPLAGGLAGDNGFLKKTFIFNNQGIYSKGAVAVSLNSDTLNTATDYRLDWQPIGREMTVTRVEKNRLYELDNMSVFDVYDKYMGKDISSRLPYSAVEFPLIKTDKNGINVCRAFFHMYEDGSVLTSGNLKQGDKVKFAFGDIDLIMSKSADTDARIFDTFQPEVIFTYSCVSRLSFLQSNVSNELKPLSNIAPIAGFFSYGEIFHQSNNNYLLNVSLTMLALTEGDKQRKTGSNTKTQSTTGIISDNLFSDKHFLVLSALINLSNTIIGELNDTNQKLEDSKQRLNELANRDPLTDLCNRRYFYEIAKTLFSSSKRNEHIFSIIMIDIDKFKNINDTYGHKAGDEALKSLALLLTKSVREADIVSRFGGEEFVILLPHTDQNSAFALAERLRQSIEKNIVQIERQLTIKFTVSLGISCLTSNSDQSIDNALDLADKALYRAKESGRNKALISE